MSKEIGPDPRRVNPKALVEQTNYKPAPWGESRSLFMDLMHFEKSWDPIKHVLRPGGIRMQIWNRPCVDFDTGAFYTVTLADYLSTFAEGATTKVQLEKKHLEHQAIQRAVASSNGGIQLVDYGHQFLIQLGNAERMKKDTFSLLKEDEKIWREAEENRCAVYDLRRRNHTANFDGDNAGHMALRVEIDGIKLRKLLRGESFVDRHNRSMGKSLNSGDLLLGFYDKNSKKAEILKTCVVLPRWIGECMRETYLRWLIEGQPSLVRNYPAPDVWHDPGTPIPT